MNMARGHSTVCQSSLVTLHVHEHKQGYPTVRRMSPRFASNTVSLSLRKQFGVCSFACVADRPRAINRRILNC